MHGRFIRPVKLALHIKFTISQIYKACKIYIASALHEKFTILSKFTNPAGSILPSRYALYAITMPPKLSILKWDNMHEFGKSAMSKLNAYQHSMENSQIAQGLDMI